MKNGADFLPTTRGRDPGCKENLSGEYNALKPVFAIFVTKQ